jgi:signal transduction histidine kinase
MPPSDDTVRRPQPEPAAKLGQTGERTRRALAIDDDERARVLIKKALPAAGFECDTAASGPEALERFRSDPDGYEVVLLDLVMPGMDGLELARTIRGFGADPAIVVVSAVGDLDRVREALRTGADEYVVKPFSVQQLRLACEQAVERRGLRRELASAERAERELLDLIFHDLKNPLAVTRGYLSLMEAMPETLSGDDIRAAADGCEAAVDIVEDLVGLGRIQRGEAELSRGSVDLERLVRETLADARRLAGRAGREIGLKTAGDVPRVSGDAPALRRTVAGLVASAVKHSRGRRPIEVSLSATPDGKKVALDVSDDGEAVPREFREAIFDGLRQNEMRRASARRGRGVSLPFAREALRLMDGSIRVEDGPGGDGGCRFVVELPACLPAARQVAAGRELGRPRSPETHESESAAAGEFAYARRKD